MKAVILCAGKSTRTYPLTVNKTKPLLRVGDKLLIEHLLDRLSSVAKEVVLVVSDNDVKKKLGDKYGKIKLVYAKQKEALGTGDALLCAEKFVDNDENFMILMGDNLYPEKSIKECASYGVSMLSQKAIDPENYGVLDIDKGFLISIDEKPSKPKSNMINTGLYVLNKRVFDVLKSVDRSKRKEYELTDAVNTLAGKIRIRCFYTSSWLSIVYPWDLLTVNQRVLSEIKGKNKGKVKQHVVINGQVSIGKGTIVMPGTHIEGPVAIGKNCVIGPNAHIRPNTSIGDNVKFGGEVVNSIIMDNTTAKHNCYIGHSVIGENVNIAAGTITSDYRHDGKNHFTIIKGKKIDTGLRKIGAFIGDNVCTGINTSIYPGRKIWPNLSTLPGEVVTKDLME